MLNSGGYCACFSCVGRSDLREHPAWTKTAPQIGLALGRSGPALSRELQSVSLLMRGPLMWIVAYSLRRPYTVGALAVLIFLLGSSALRRMSTDILPTIDIPSVNLVWTYDGLNAPEMAAKITSFSEIAAMNNIDDVRSIQSETSNGVALVRIELQRNAKIETALTQASAISQTILRRMPQGVMPPILVRNSAGSVPILHLALSSSTLTEAQLYDYARLAMRAQIQTIPGIRMTLPYGGQARQIMVDLDPVKLDAYGLSPFDVSRAVAEQNVTLPSGVIREGERELSVSVNSSPETIAAFNDLPIRATGGHVIFMRDVANVRDGGAVQTNIARVDGASGVIVSLLKLGEASTIEIVDQLRTRLPQIQAAAPEGIRIEPIFDQSVFVRTAMSSVVKEAFLVGVLVAAVVFVFLASHRSAFIVLTSIPLSILASVATLHALGHTLNLMTLGGLALAIGILVDNAMVEIENINRNIGLGKPLRQAILDGAQQIVFPEFVSTLSICIVFVPAFVLSGASAYVFAPLAVAVISAMAASFILSRTLVPTLAHTLLPSSIDDRSGHIGSSNWRARVERLFARLSDLYRVLLQEALNARLMAAGAAIAILGLSAAAASSLGREFFPVVDAGIMRLHIRAPIGSRLEETAARFGDVQKEIQKIIPRAELQAIVENIGRPEPANLSWVESLASGPADGEMLIQLKPGHRPTAQYESAIRRMLGERFPQVTAFFRTADMVGQTLNEGAAASIDIRVSGRDAAGNLATARKIIEQSMRIPGAADVTLRQITDWPEYFVVVDRMRSLQLGLQQQDIANALLVSLSSSAVVQSNFWADKGFSYAVAVQTPPNSVRTIDDMLNTPVTSSSGNKVLLRTIASVIERKVPATVSRQTLAPTFNVLVNVRGRDLGSVYSDVKRVTDGLATDLKPGNVIAIAGQAAAMEEAYSDLASGLGVSVALVFLVMVVNFQSWAMPLAVISALPLSIGGVILGLYATGTLLSAPALMGLIMAIGVATANSVLVVSFARDRLVEGADPLTAALDGAATRLRPVLMTAVAMLIGMIPMALGLSDGGEQNAPLARAVIGGLLGGTTGTLLFVPLMFTTLCGLWRDTTIEVGPETGRPDASVANALARQAAP
jgi:multidrug efflux pump subunit AcrB